MSKSKQSSTDTRSKTKIQLQAKCIKSEKVGEPQLKELWILRLAYLKLTMTEAQDYRRFCDYCTRPNTYIFTFRDSSGDLQAFYTFSSHLADHDGKKGVLLHSKYYYVNTPARGHPKIPASAWQLLPKLLLGYGLKRLYIVAFSFPTSYVSLTRTFGRSYTIQGDDATPWERSVLASLAYELNGENWDAKNGVIRQQNVPIGEDKAASKNVTELREAYLRMNPQWAEGVSLPIMMRLDLATIKSLIETNIRRSKRAK
jgi:hypothetical protein